jgi:hypothetical protein
MTVRLRFGAGGQGHAELLTGDRLHVVSEVPFAPGSPVSCTAPLADGELDLEGRSQGSKRRDDGRFDVRLRLINLRRADRERLALALTPGSDSPG